MGLKTLMINNCNLNQKSFKMIDFNKMSSL